MVSVTISLIYRQASKSTEPILRRHKLGIWNHTSVLVKSLKNHALGKWNANFSFFSQVLPRKRETHAWISLHNFCREPGSFIGMSGANGYGFLAILVWNRVWFVYSSLELGMFLEEATSSSLGEKTISLLDILNCASRILQCWSYYVKINSARHQHDTERTRNRAGL